MCLGKELGNAGFRVLRHDDLNASDNAISLFAEIVEVYCDVYMTYDADVALMVDMSAKAGQVDRMQYKGEGGVGLNWAATAASYAESLSQALQDAIAKILVDLRKME